MTIMVTIITTLTHTTMAITTRVMLPHHHEDDGNSGDSADPGQHRMHVHFDACCPSIVLPAQDAPAQRRPSDRMAILPVEPMQGAPPDHLLRPPIPVSF